MAASRSTFKQSYKFAINRALVRYPKFEVDVASIIDGQLLDRFTRKILICKYKDVTYAKLMSVLREAHDLVSHWVNKLPITLAEP